MRIAGFLLVVAAFAWGCAGSAGPGAQTQDPGRTDILDLAYSELAQPDASGGEEGLSKPDGEASELLDAEHTEAIQPDAAPTDITPADEVSPDAAPTDVAPPDVSPTDVAPPDDVSPDVAPLDTAPPDDVPPESAPADVDATEPGTPADDGADPSGEPGFDADACEPACAGRDCGDDGCGGTCGSCTGGAACQGGVCTGPTWWFHDLWQPDPSQPLATNGVWAAQFDFVSETDRNSDYDGSTPHLPDLAPGSISDYTSADWQTVWNQVVFSRDAAGYAINSRDASQSHPAWAQDKTFIAPRDGLYHLRADDVRPGGCPSNEDWDGSLLEVYTVTGGAPWKTNRIWAKLITQRNCDPTVISLNQYLAGGERLVIRHMTHSASNAADQLLIDPWVRFLGDDAAWEGVCTRTVPASGGDDRAAIQAALDWAATATASLCPRAEVRLDHGQTYGIGWTLNLPGDHVTLTGAGNSPTYWDNRSLGVDPARLLFLGPALDGSNNASTVLDVSGNASEIRGIDIDYAPEQVPFTQGEIHWAGNSFTVTWDAGFGASPVDTTPGSVTNCVFYDRPDATGFPDAYRVLVYTWQGADCSCDAGWNCTVSDSVKTQAAAATKVVFLRRPYQGNIIFRGRETAFTDVTLRAAPSLGVQTYGGASGLHLRRFKVLPAAGRLVSTPGDPVHLQSIRRGPTVEDCEFTGFGDDAVASYCNVRTPGNADDFCLEFDEPAGDDQWPWTLHGATRTACGYSSQGWANVSASGEGTIVRGTSFHEARGRAIMLQSGNSLIAHDDFRNLVFWSDGANLHGRDMQLSPYSVGEGFLYSYNVFARFNTTDMTFPGVPSWGVLTSTDCPPSYSSEFGGAEPEQFLSNICFNGNRNAYAAWNACTNLILDCTN